MRASVVRACVGVAFGLIATSWSSHARADIAAAEALFNEGQKLFDAGQIPAACKKFTESLAADHAVGTEINLARCHEKEGKNASAWAEYKEVQEASARAGQKEREAYARDAAGRLESQLHKFNVVVKSNPEGLKVTRDGADTVPNEDLPVDPGDHVIEVSAKGKKTWTKTITVVAGPGTDPVLVPDLPDASTDVLMPPPDAPSPGWSKGRYIGLGVAAGGVVALGVGAVFQLVALSEKGKIPDNPGAGGTAAQRANYATQYNSHYQPAQNDQTTAIICAIGGGALLATGLVVFFVSPAQKTGSIQVVPSIGAGQTGATLLGTF